MEADYNDNADVANLICRASGIIKVEKQVSFELAEKLVLKEMEGEDFEQALFDVETENIKLQQELKEERDKNKKQADEIKKLQKKLAEKDSAESVSVLIFSE